MNNPCAVRFSSFLIISLLLKLSNVLRQIKSLRARHEERFTFGQVDLGTECVSCNHRSKDTYDLSIKIGTLGGTIYFLTVKLLYKDYLTIFWPTFMKRDHSLIKRTQFLSRQCYYPHVALIRILLVLYWPSTPEPVTII